MSSAVIRPAHAADAEPVRALMEQAYQRYIADMGQKPAPMTDDYAARVASGEVFIAEADGTMVGAAVLVADGDTLWLETVGVFPALQGRGFGRQLIALAESEARARGHLFVRLYTNEAMIGNLRLYPRLGYRQTERSLQAGFARVFFEKRVGP